MRFARSVGSLWRSASTIDVRGIDRPVPQHDVGSENESALTPFDHGVRVIIGRCSVGLRNFARHASAIRQRRAWAGIAWFGI
jgi:hypothetical protein